jgi:hypothetical protein
VYPMQVTQTLVSEPIVSFKAATFADID